MTTLLYLLFSNFWSKLVLSSRIGCSKYLNQRICLKQLSKYVQYNYSLSNWAQFFMCFAMQNCSLLSWVSSFVYKNSLFENISWWCTYLPSTIMQFLWFTFKCIFCLVWAPKQKLAKVGALMITIAILTLLIRVSKSKSCFIKFRSLIEVFCLPLLQFYQSDVAPLKNNSFFRIDLGKSLFVTFVTWSRHRSICRWTSRLGNDQSFVNTEWQLD